MVFSKEWFHKHQRVLLWLCNTPVIKYWFRWVLRIHKDLKWSEKIACLEPNNYKVVLSKNDKEIKVRADFRTHEKFGKRLYYAFKPMWYLFHAWDYVTMQKPEWNLGFDTLVAYPGDSAITVTGQINRVNVNGESFSTIRGGAGTGPQIGNTIKNITLRADGNSNLFDVLQRGFSTVDTSSIGDANINTAIWSLCGFSTATIVGLGATTLDIVSSTQASYDELVASDYGAVGATVFGQEESSGFLANEYNEITLNGSGIENISKDGISGFAFRTGFDTENDFSGTWVAGAQTSFYFYDTAQDGTSQDPKLTVEYTLPATATGNFFLFF